MPVAGADEGQTHRPSLSAGRDINSTDQGTRQQSARSGPSTRKRTTSKVVLMDDPDVISPLMLGTAKELTDDFSLDRPSSRSLIVPKQSRKLSGRPSISNLTRSPEMMATTDSLSRRYSLVEDDDRRDSLAKSSEILSQITGWLKEQKARRGRRHHHRKDSSITTADGSLFQFDGQDESARRRQSDASDTSLALDKLEGILNKASLIHASADSLRSRRSSKVPFTPSSFRKLRRQSSVVSDSEDPDREYDRVPGCDALLDNSKTLSYAGGASSSQLDLINPESASAKDVEAWNSFKYEILRIAHTLRLKRWRHIPMSASPEIGVERLSGALTNAVYMVSPPPPTATPSLKHPAPKLLLRIYGPQVEHLIDRESELQILRRLARKRIGPRLLGTFANGRFEEYFHAQTLRPQDLRVPGTSKQIAKRMRELHEGIELLPTEREGGPFVWRNWDKWVDRASRIVSHLDRLTTPQAEPSSDKAIARLQKKGYICGTDWQTFRRTVELYRSFLATQYNGQENIAKQLVFAHNDTQYGNILRLQPPGESPLLLPANEHRQLVVIDFEYANANTPGYELANHFSEWCYNYHDELKPWACQTEHYPQPEEQMRFALAYLRHSPYFQSAGSVVSSPVLRAAGLRREMSERGPAVSEKGFGETDGNTSTADLEMEDLARQLLHEVRLWRVACSAQWAAWGIVQAVIPDFANGQELGLDETDEKGQDDNSDKAEEGRLSSGPEQSETPGLGDEQAEEEFDYLSYARDRSMLFWGDILQLGLVKKEDLPASLVRDVKIIKY